MLQNHITDQARILYNSIAIYLLIGICFNYFQAIRIGPGYPPAPVDPNDVLIKFVNQ
ncbi:hypothetical protein BC833DRAFT_608086 [Globomyces pollinis-pini]|nr:hypothetical protein BC833DRAFT_608086 [Globomyces pollinis-pini]